MSRDRVIQIAEQELGYTESPPNSNRTKYGAAYGLDGYPWCDEVWVPVAGYNGRYEVSNKGRVRNADGRILKPIQRRGYLCLNLSDGKEIKDRKIHRLVAEAF
ncbi:MAG: NUMOD4 domain-containing protein, partial [Oscillospiraceae bacterium]|nr:NUMOD4 domain-containing protein [Oscillospiraceae bacterium]